MNTIDIIHIILYAIPLLIFYGALGHAYYLIKTTPGLGEQMKQDAKNKYYKEPTAIVEYK